MKKHLLPGYNNWHGAKQRCNNPKSKDYKRYGGRGIKMCKRWLNSFDSILQDMGEPPSKDHSLDRMNNNKNYCKSNCRWATRLEQGRNKRNNRIVNINGKKITLGELAVNLNMHSSMLFYRLNTMSIKDAVSLNKHCRPRLHKSVKQISLAGKVIRIFPSIKQAALNVKCSSGNIIAALKDNSKTAANFKWRYNQIV